jgi:hypothetical protein
LLSINVLIKSVNRIFAWAGTGMGKTAWNGVQALEQFLQIP